MKKELSARQLILIAIAIVVALCIAKYENLLPYRWQTYTSPDGTFSVLLPGKPKVQTNQLRNEDGSTTKLTLVGAEPIRNASYSCSYFDRGDLGKKTPEQALESAIAGSLTNIQGTVISLQRIHAQGYPGIDWQARARGNSLVDGRFLLVGNRLYMLMAVARTDRDRELRTIQRVFDSFKVLKP